MRAIGMAERALSLMVERSKARVAFGRPLADQGTVREAIALSRMEIDQARLYVLKTADLIDKYGAKGARTEISAIKVAAPGSPSTSSTGPSRCTAVPASATTPCWPASTPAPA